MAASLGGAVEDSQSIEAVREIHETIAEELSMCARFAQAAVSGNTIHRLVLLGGESRSGSLAAHLSRAVGVEATVGDPIKRFESGESFAECEDVPCRPQWAVACGLCCSPLEL
jgi:Tfp pilus assembly PilM family ATPase